MIRDEPSVPRVDRSQDELPLRSETASAPARADTEALLASAVKELLDIPHADLTKHFVDLGGDSLAACKLAARLSEGLGIDIPPILPFEADTLQDLVIRIDAIQGAYRSQRLSVEGASGERD